MDRCPLTDESCIHGKNHYIAEIIDGEPNQFQLCGKCAAGCFNESLTSELKQYSTLDILHGYMIDALNMTKPFDSELKINENSIEFKRNKVRAYYATINKQIQDSISDERFEDSIVFRNELRKTNHLKKQIDYLEQKIKNFIDNKDAEKAKKISNILNIIDELYIIILEKITKSN